MDTLSHALRHPQARRCSFPVVGLVHHEAMHRDVSDPLAVLRTLFAGTHRCVSAIEGHYEGRADPGSPASRDDSAVTPVSDAWGPDPFAVAQTVAGCYEIACEDHLQALDELLKPPVPALADLTVARGVLEAAARAWWLYDPYAEPIERLARGWTERLHARRERDKLLRSLDTEPDDASTVEEQVRQAAGEDNLPYGEHQGTVWVGRPRPSTTQLVTWMDPTTAEQAWRWMSGSSHGLSVHVLLRSEPIDDERSPTGLRLAERPRSLQDVYTVAAFALEAHAQTFDRRLAYHGWEDTQWRQWRRHVREKLRPAFRTPNDS